jgi:diaminopimelate epimerase
LSFFQYTGCGNRFLLFDNRKLCFPIQDKILIQKLCNTETDAIDGIVLFENSHCADFRMRIFNADGGEAEMCGNGLRCLLYHLDKELPESKRKRTIETMSGIHSGYCEEEQVYACLPPAINLEWNLRLKVGEQEILLHSLNTGVPHLVIFHKDITDAPVDTLGKSLRQHSRFAPCGSNVNFASISEDGIVKIRTYERGVERETQACGTGACAVAIAAITQKGLKSPVRIQVASKEYIEIQVKKDGQILMKGPVNKEVSTVDILLTLKEEEDVNIPF